MIFYILTAVFVLLLLAIAVIYLIGRSMPIEHTASLSRIFETPPEKIYLLIKNFKEYSNWRPNLKEIKPISDVSWVEVDSRGESMTYSFIRDKKNILVESKIMNEDKPFGGYWIFDIRKSGKNTELKITENGKVFPPVFRFLARYVFGHESTMKSYMNYMSIEIERRRK
jgi:hypothetical protein